MSEEIRKTKEALALMNSMIRSGEDHSEQSEKTLADAFVALDDLSKKLS